MYHAYWREYIAILVWNGDAVIQHPTSLLLSSVSYPNLFPRHIGLTRNNSKCFFCQSGFLPEPVAKIQKSLERCTLLGEKLKNNDEMDGMAPLSDNRNRGLIWSVISNQALITL